MDTKFQKLMDALDEIADGKFGDFSGKNQDPDLVSIFQKLNDTAAQLALREQKLIQKESFLSTVLASLPVLISYLDQDFNYLYVNEAYQQWFGITKDVCLKSNIRDIVGEEGCNVLMPYLQATLRGQPQEFESDMLYKYAGKKTISVRYIPDFDSRGDVKGIIVIAQDVSAIRKSQQEKAIAISELIAARSKLETTLAELSASANETQKLINGIPALISRWDTQSLNIAANEGYLAVYGKSPLEMRGKHVKDVIGPDLYAKAKPQIDKALAGEFGTLQSEVVTREGAKKYLQVIFRPEIDSGGQVQGYFVVALDVTTQKIADFEKAAAQEQLEISENYLRFILDSIQQGLWGLDLQGRVTFINQSAVRLLGYEHESEILGRAMHALVHYAHADGSPHPLEDCPMYDSFRRGIVHKVSEDVLWRKDGKSLPVSYCSTPVKVNGHCIGSVVSFEDLTETKRLQTELESERIKAIRNAKLASMGLFSAGIAHEINNPLAVISGATSLIAKMQSQSSAPSSEKMLEKVELIKKSTARISKIVNGLRKFSRSDSKPQYKPCSLSQLSQEIAPLVEIHANRFDTKLNIHAVGEARIVCDEAEIIQVLVNLVHNAIDAVRELSERWVTVQISEHVDCVVVQVTDSGPGIPLDVQAKLFEPFFTTKGTNEGTGLGLSICKGILDEHSASIAVLNGVQNTCFEIRFPKSKEATNVA